MKNEDMLYQIEKKIESKQLYKVFGGLKNNCFSLDVDSKKYFVKFYNPDTQYSYHLSKTRCESEFAMCKYLNDLGCAVPKPIALYPEKLIGVYNFVDGVNLFNLDEVSLEISMNIIDELVKIHAIPVSHKIENCIFRETTVEDLERYLNDSLNFLAKYMFSDYDVNHFSKLYKEIANYIYEQKQVFGNMQMHNGNIMISADGVVFVDFEKSPSHFRQIDLITFLNARNWDLKKDFKLLDYYLSYFPDLDKERFYACYDLLFIIDNLRSLIKIQNNLNKVKYKWVEENGKRYKVLVKDKSELGLLWNKERKENIDRRIANIFLKKYSDSNYSNRLRGIISTIMD